MPGTGVQMIGGTRATVTRFTYGLDDFQLNVQSGNTKSMDADGQYQTLYELDIDDGIGEWFGRGRNENPLQAQGFAGVRFVNDTAAALAEGRWRIAVRNPQGRRLYNLYEGSLGDDDLYDGAAGGGTLKSRRDRTAFPNTQADFETEPHEITIDLNVTSAITVDDAEAETNASLEGYRAEALD